MNKITEAIRDAINIAIPAGLADSITECRPLAIGYALAQTGADLEDIEAAWSEYLNR